ncbi:single-stranded DNA-binding protein [Candidatus Roizmanbacteria bacterium]|nr:single-stranded DNA-binding protein [Candidatus Roizmanbacteria bacterium]
MASRSLNRVTLIGNLTRDPELKYTPAGTAVCTFGVATNRSWTTADGQTKEETQYHRIVAWQKLAELSGKLLTKGRKIYLEGRLTYRNFTGKDGIQKTVAEIILDDFIVFGDGARKNGTPEEVRGEHAIDEEFTIPHEEIAHYEEPERAKEDVGPDDIPF